MLLIRDSQIAALEEASFERFIGRMLPHLRERFPAPLTATTDADVCALLRQETLRAESFGVQDQNDIRRFLEYVVEYGRGFGETAGTEWAGRILRGPGTGTDKMDRVDQHVTFVLDLKQPDVGL